MLLFAKFHAYIRNLKYMCFVVWPGYNNVSGMDLLVVVVMVYTELMVTCGSTICGLLRRTKHSSNLRGCQRNVILYVAMSLCMCVYINGFATLVLYQKLGVDNEQWYVNDITHTFPTNGTTKRSNKEYIKANM